MAKKKCSGSLGPERPGVSAMRHCGGSEVKMLCSSFPAKLGGGHASAARTHRLFLEKRRIYNRLYMRSWRADPRHRACEREHRQQWHYARKLRDALRVHHPHANDRGCPVCGFCRKNPPVTKVWRLEIRDLAPGGYVEVRVPYCGEC
jgi:hypothetical protein